MTQGQNAGVPSEKLGELNFRNGECAGLAYAADGPKILIDECKEQLRSLAKLEDQENEDESENE